MNMRLIQNNSYFATGGGSAPDCRRTPYIYSGNGEDDSHGLPGELLPVTGGGPGRESSLTPAPLNLRQRAEKRKPPVVRPPRRGGGGGIRRRGRRRARTFVGRQKIAALIIAVGSESQLDGEAKLFLRCGRNTLIRHMLDRLQRCVGTVLVATAEEQLEKTRAIVGGHAEVHGTGPEYLNAAGQLFESTTAPFLLVHDVSWPFASPQLIREVIRAGMETGAAAAVNYVDTALGTLDVEGLVSLREEPEQFVCVQSPTLYSRVVLETALQLAGDANLAELSPWELVQRAGNAISPVRNEASNIRIRTALDWSIARGAVWPWVRQRWERERAGTGQKPGTRG